MRTTYDIITPILPQNIQDTKANISTKCFNLPNIDVTLHGILQNYTGVITSHKKGYLKT